MTGPDSKMPCLLFLDDAYYHIYSDPKVHICWLVSLFVILVLRDVRSSAFKFLNDELDVKVMVMLVMMMMRTM